MKINVWKECKKWIESINYHENNVTMQTKISTSFPVLGNEILKCHDIRIDFFCRSLHDKHFSSRGKLHESAVINLAPLCEIGIKKISLFQRETASLIQI